MMHPPGETGSSDQVTAGAQRDPTRARRRLPFTLGLITMVLSLCSGLATYVILTGLTPIVPTHRVVVGVLLINLVLVLAMVMIIAWQVTGLWLARRRQVAGAQLHVRIVSLFSVIAVVPAILLPSSPACRSTAASIIGSPSAPSPSSRTRSTWRPPICKSTVR